MRTSIREDSACSSADLLYGSPLRLPGDCFSPSAPVPLASDFAQQLRAVIGASSPMPVVHHGLPPSRVDPALMSSSHVFLRVDAVRKPLVQPYLGPFKVLQKNQKTFIISQSGKEVTVTVDRLKPAWLLPPPSAAQQDQRRPPLSPPAPTPAPSTPDPSPTVSLRVSSSAPPSTGVPDITSASEFPPLRSGRVPRPVHRYQA